MMFVIASAVKQTCADTEEVDCVAAPLLAMTVAQCNAF